MRIMGSPVHLLTTVAALRDYLSQVRSGGDNSEANEGQQICGEMTASAEQLSRSWVRTNLYRLRTVGFVPTMGALHRGHLSLIQRARRENDVLVVSIFVNPLQFGPNEDFQQYPRSLEQDQHLCQQAGVDAIFVPPSAELYGAQIGDAGIAELTQVVPPASMTLTLCGRSRPGHFQGVATVVTKLLNLVQPNRAYFGQKDAQQLAIIRRLVEDLHLPVEIVACPIVREANGLALSSRNRYLTTEQREQAAVLYHSLCKAKTLFRQGQSRREPLLAAVREELATEPAVHLEYVELVHPQTLVPLAAVKAEGLVALAAHVSSTRLIDNVLLHNRKPIVAIDGPAGAGKSTVTRQIAQALGLLYLDTGAMYRAVTWLVLHLGIAVDHEAAIAELVERCQIQLTARDDPETPTQVSINGHDVTQAIRGLEVTNTVSAIAAQPAVRRALVRQQQQYGIQGGIVAEGRDVGTHVFPDAELKIFLTASVRERARRRQQDLKQQGLELLSLEALEQAIIERDRKDSSRNIAPLRPAEDAIELCTDGLSVAEVTAKVVHLYQERLGIPAAQS